MFTGIIECVGFIVDIKKEKGNVHFTVESEISSHLKVDQSVSHNGVCLTVTQVENNTHRVTAIEETLLKTNLGTWKINDHINLERCMLNNGRFDGHIVQGHIDTTARCSLVEDKYGSYIYCFDLIGDASLQSLLVNKGSVCINGVSLTIVDCEAQKFSVAIIPYTFNHTNFRNLKSQMLVNIELDIIGKYIHKMLANRSTL